MVAKRTRNRIKTSTSGKVFDTFNYLFIILFCVSIMFPLWNMIVVSLSRAQDISYLNLNLYPKHPTLDAYIFCLRNNEMWVALRNSVARTVIGTLYHLIVCCFAAFAMTRTEMPFLKVFTIIFLITMFFGGGLIPTYLNIRRLGLLDNFLVFILPGGFSMYNTIIIRNYFFSIDKAMEESATLDGASMLQVMFWIILPLSMPVLATVGLWQMVGHWNAWFDNMIYARSPSLVTLQYLLRRISNDVQAMNDEMQRYAATAEQTKQYTAESIIAATTVIVVTPIICVYPFLQRYFVKGIMLGAVKG
ncbi:MAG: carbohydrate ABC transporter permease [Clostridia bacterium]|nr:carbohydrate ABC transporter permease [Clostridia bacterium]